MKKHMLLLALVLGVYSSASSAGFDFGKLIETMGQVPSQQKSDTNQPAEQPATTSGQQTAKEQALSLSLFGKTSLEDEIRIGRQVSGDLLGAAPLVKDETLQRYVNSVGRWVAMQSSRPDLPWHFGVIESDDINAFSAPGGYVFVTKGLYKRLNNEAELAGVLAHEIAHVSLKHHLNLLKQSQLIGLLAQTVSKEVKGGDQTVQNLIGNGAEMMARSLDKEAEFEADRTAVVYAARSGYDAWGLPTVLQDMATINAKDDRLALLYKTHPTAADRVERLGDAVGDRFDSLAPGKDFPDRFYRIR
jgi:predicted Zn-dependent protease